MKKIAFYVMNKKGYDTLKFFIQYFGTDRIEYVVSNTDENMKIDFFQEIQILCEKNTILFFKKNQNFYEKEENFDGYKFIIGWRWIIQNHTNLIIFHDSLLPKYRGFSPLVNMLIAGTKTIGVTALWAGKTYDTGDIIMQESIDIEYPLKIQTAINQIIPLYYQLVKQIFNKVLDNEVLPHIKQNEDESTYSLWLDEKDYFIDWKNWEAEKIKRFIDAVGYPFDNAKTFMNDSIIQLLDVTVIKDIKVNERERHIGKVVFIKDNIPIIICRKGLLRLDKIIDLQNNKLNVNFRTRFY